MDSITIYPKNDKQKSLLESLLEEMKVRFEVVKLEDKTLLSKDEFTAKIDKSIEQADLGKIKRIAKEEQKKFLGL
ncbi:hypothetical protein FYC62_08420 [Pedobacter aquae]|uniref:Uncharacterized protein n=1 Tax=Pedobacter aquae TaxID=2605747 RepID=A0A5C0VKK5_9SPHI|nr:DUF2683 family protein [Pedobacter aquae]QEK51680.1 hypothetical protein FYC62_08420 [Pedobacter aquae]